MPGCVFSDDKKAAQKGVSVQDSTLLTTSTYHYIVVKNDGITPWHTNLRQNKFLLIFVIVTTKRAFAK